MAVLTRNQMQTCITAAYNTYVTSTANTFQVDVGGFNVSVVPTIDGSRYNCGVPGHTMPRVEAAFLRAWCINNPGPDNGSNWSYGFRDTDGGHPNTVNVTLINRTPLMFNFHVNLS